MNWQTFIPAFEYCTDNAAMIAITGYYKFLEKDFTDLSVSPSAKADWSQPQIAQITQKKLPNA